MTVAPEEASLKVGERTRIVALLPGCVGYNVTDLRSSNSDIVKVDGDVQLAARVKEQDDKVDELFDKVKEEAVELIRTGSLEAHAALDLGMAAKYFERIGDHAKNILDSARELHEKDLTFSPEAQQELDVLTRAVTDILSTATEAYKANDAALAVTVEPLEETIDQLSEEIRLRHIHRLQQGVCTIQMGFILSDLLTNIERASDHCSNIAVSVIEELACRPAPARHDLICEEVKAGGAFGEDLRRDRKKYHLPEA